MFMPPASISQTGYQLTRKQVPLALRPGNSEIFQQQWEISMNDGTLDTVYEAINALVKHAQDIALCQVIQERKLALENLVSTLPYATHTIQRTLSFYRAEGRMVVPGFDVNDVFEAAVSQFLPSNCNEVSKAIRSFVPKFSLNYINEFNLTRIERKYRTWVTPKLVTSLISSACHFNDDECYIQEPSYSIPLWVQ